MIVKPLLKFIGAKNWCASQLAPIFREYVESTGGHYVEPFLGGASLALATNAPQMALSDAMDPLIEFYQMVAAHPGEVAWGLSAFAILGVDEENYYRVRDMRPTDPIQRAARFLYLARLGFNGIIRHNRKGEFNVPFGDATYRKSVVGRSARDAIDALFPNREKIQRVSDVLSRAEIFCGDFGDLVSASGEEDLIVADPPYDGTFDGYSGKGFGPADQERLAESLYDAAQRGAVIVAFNALTDSVKELYGWCEVIEVDEKRSVAANGSRRQRAPCAVLVSDSTMAARIRTALGLTPGQVPLRAVP